MRSGNQSIINKTKIAVEWINSHVILSVNEINQLEAHKNYFCSIHSYLDGERSSALKYTMSAIKKGGFKVKYISILIKSIIGRKILQKLLR